MRTHAWRMERQKRQLIQLCEVAYSICMGDCEPSDMDDWVDDYNALKRELFNPENAESIHHESKPNDHE